MNQTDNQDLLQAGNQTWTLIKAGMWNSFKLNKLGPGSTPKERFKYAGFGLLIIYAIGSSIFSLVFYFWLMADTLAQLDALKILVAMAFFTPSFMTVLFSIYKSSGYLFSFRDYDLLMSLPLKTTSVFTSKLIFLYGSNLFTSLLFGMPILSVYGVRASMGVSYYMMALLALLLVPVLPVILGSLLSILLAGFSSRFKGSNLVMLIGSFILLCAFIVGNFFINRFSVEQARVISGIFDGMVKWFYPSSLFIDALVNGNVAALVGFIAIYGGIGGLFVVLFARSFQRINARMSERVKSSDFRMRALRVSSPFMAFFRKEIRFYFSSYIYVLNTGVGVIMMTLFGGSIFLFGKDTVSKVLEIPMAENFLLPVVAAVISFCVVMTCTTSPSISLEGRNLGILKSLPLEPMTIFLGKVGVNLILLLPAVVLNVGLLSAGLGFDGLEAILFLCVEVLYSLMIAIAGILVNLYLPKLEWTAQVAVVKQSASVLVAMLIGFGSIVTPILLYTFLKPGSNLLFMAGLATGLLLLVAILWQLLKNRGVRQFESL